MTTSGGDDSHPHGDDHPRGGTPPPPPPPGGANPYAPGAPPPGSWHATRSDTPWDPVSIAALVTTVLCCTGPVAVVLGAVGIARTRDGVRRGRWMAVVGVVGGVLATLLVAGAIVLGVWVADQEVDPADAEVGQCVNVNERGETVHLIETSCTEDHDAEVVHVGEYDPADDPDAGAGLTAAICLENLSRTDMAALEAAGIRPGDLTVIADDPDNMTEGDPYTCYVQPDRTLTEPVL